MEVHIENDPNLKCKDYNEDHEYPKCLHERYIEKVIEKLGYIPPWLGYDISIWCNGQKYSSLIWFEGVSEELRCGHTFMKM